METRVSASNVECPGMEKVKGVPACGFEFSESKFYGPSSIPRIKRLSHALA